MNYRQKSAYLIKDPILNLELICEGAFQIELSDREEFTTCIHLNTVSFFFPEEDDQIDHLIMYIPLEMSGLFLEVFFSSSLILIRRDGYLIDLEIHTNINIQEAVFDE